MNKTIYINILPALLLVISTIFVSQNTLAEAAESTQPVSVDQERQATAEEMGYFFGYSFGNMLKEGGTNEVDVEALNKGMADSLSDAAPNMSPEAQAAVAVAVRAQQEEVQRMRTEMQNQISSQQKVQGEAFLVENGKKPGVITTATGLQYMHEVEGSGGMPSVADTVEVHYTGMLLDGTEFDSSVKRGTPASFGLGQVIPGWTEGLQLMRVGGKTRLFIPAELGYGSGGTRGIPPNAVLIFDVELLSIK